MSLPLEKTFIIDEIGETSGVHFTGTFTVKRVLSKREEIAADIRRRFILGPQPEGAMSNIANDAFVLGQLYARIIDAPQWWETSDGGLDFKDNNVLMKIFEETMKAEIEYRNDLSDKAKKAEPVVAKAAKKQPTIEQLHEENE